MESDAYLDLPLFAVPEYTLFPDTLVPFHVYESRQEAMLLDALSGRRLLAIAAAPGDDRATSRVLVPHPVCGLGRVVSDRRYPDGRLDLFVHGLERVRVERVVAREPWARVDVAPMPDVAERGTDEAHRRLVTVMSQIVRSLGEGTEQLAQVLASSRDAGVLTNRLASVLVDAFAARQALLELRCPARRCDALLERVAELLLRIDDTGEGEHAWVN